MPRYELSVAEDSYHLDVGENVIDWTEGEYVEVRSMDYPEYAGSTDWTPSSAAQLVPTAGTVLLTDITIEPIPSNYGLITWDGSVLMVS